jgi:hypothetical protein
MAGLPHAVRAEDLAAHVEARDLLASVLGQELRLKRSEADRLRPATVSSLRMATASSPRGKHIPRTAHAAQ